MGCSSSKEQPKDAQKKAEKPQEPKKEAPKKPEAPTKKEAEAPKKAEAPKEEPKPQEPVKEEAAPVSAPPQEESAKPSPSESEPAVVVSAKESHHDSVKPSTASVHEATPTPSERAATPPPPEPAAVPQLQLADTQATPNRASGKTPRGERAISPRRYPVEVAIRRESMGTSPGARKVAETDYAGPGPATTFAVESVYRCFDEGNGLLFRVVNDTYHTWAFYNDTDVYTMHVSVSFGHESMVRPLGKTTQVVHDEETGHCTLEVDVGPGETEPFMRGEYNGFVTYYDADPIPYDARKK